MPGARKSRSSRTLGKCGKRMSPLRKSSAGTSGVSSVLTSPTKLNITGLTSNAFVQSGRLSANSEKEETPKGPQGLDQSIQQPEVESDSSQSSDDGSSGSKTTETDSETDVDKLSASIHQISSQRLQNKRKMSSETETNQTNGTTKIATSSLSRYFDTGSQIKRPRLAVDLQMHISPDMFPVRSKNTVAVHKGSQLVQTSSVLLSPIADKMTNIFKSLSDPANSNSILESKQTPVNIPKAQSPLSLDKSATAGKAVKTASVTPPGNLTSPVKPLLRLRKPKPQLQSPKDAKKDLAEGSGAVKKTGVNKKLLVGSAAVKSKLRGRPLKTPVATSTSTGNGSPPEEPTNADCSNSTEFSVLKSSVEDLAFHGVGMSVHCLPPPPETAEEQTELAAKVASIFLSEVKPSPPSYWKSTDSGAGSSARWQKSQRDLKNLDSYDITGRMVDAEGNVFYHCSWKDGHGNESPDEEDESGPYYYIDEGDVDDAEAMWTHMDAIDEAKAKPRGNKGETGKVETKDDVEIVGVSEGIGNVRSMDAKLNASPTIVLERQGSNDPPAGGFIISGIGIRNKNNLRLSNLAPHSGEEIIDLTDSP